MAIPFYEIEVDHGPIAVRQAADIADEVVIGEFVIAGEIIGGFIDALRQGRHQLVPFFDPINAGADKDASGPSFERAFTAKGREVSVELDKAFLEPVVRVFGISGITKT